jgi:hypothetical protein
MQLRARKPPTTKPSGYSASDLRAEGYKDAEIGGITGRSLDWPEQDYNEPDYDAPDKDDHYELETAPAPKKRRAGKKAPLKKGHDDDEVDEDDLETAPVPRKKKTQRKTAPLPARLTQPFKESELATTTPNDVPICMGIKPLEPFTADDIIEGFSKQCRPPLA